MLTKNSIVGPEEWTEPVYLPEDPPTIYTF